jgi:eukaryotic-like serine/threonine-protein kinase
VRASEREMDYSKGIEHTLFEVASGMTDPAERSAFLDKTCQGDPAMRDRLEKLLNVRGKADNFFDMPPVRMPADMSRIAVLEGEDQPARSQAVDLVGGGAFIGRFKLMSRIGEGGCGVVYRAEQLEPVRREVALKVIRLGMDTEAVIARFELERQALAMMEHPNIARVLDAGTTTYGCPFFVMELVDGEKITDFCKEGRLPLRRRLEMFLLICGAIQHAHQKGVVHRDIKPSNVLVRELDGEPVPKVIDFGIAKATMGDRPDSDTVTAIGQFLGTPAYMSPEQAKGGSDVDTRSDIYSLGALLYELIADRPPFDPQQLKDEGFDEVRRIVCEVDPPPPSADLEGANIVELDWIVMKAMSKERQLRYDTASDLAADVRRFLENEPVLAGPPKRSYRLRKLIRRNRTTFFAGSIAVFCLLAGLGISTRLYVLEKQAREEQERLRQLAEISRNNEMRLRQAGEYQNLVSQAAVQIRYQDLEGADKLLSMVPVASTPSSLEAAATYMTVADWHLMAGRWKEAARRYSSLVRAISNVDESDNDTVSRNLLYACAATCFTGDFAAYERIRMLAIERFAGTSHPVVAEQVLKVCLFLPADEPLLGRLRPLADLLAEELETKGSIVERNEHLAAWSCFSLALMNYRDGNDASASRWAARCLSSTRKNPAREASARIILAMVEHRAGHNGIAVTLLDQASPPVMENSQPPLKHGDDNSGSWHAWLTARILLNEAESLILK